MIMNLVDHFFLLLHVEDYSEGEKNNIYHVEKSFLTLHEVCKYYCPFFVYQNMLNENVIVDLSSYLCSQSPLHYYLLSQLGNVLSRTVQ